MLWLLAAAGLAVDSARSFEVPVARGESLHVVEFGDPERRPNEEPVVLIPGFFGSAFGFRKLVPLLEEAGYRATVIEPLGTGFSSRPEHGDYSFSAQSRRIAAVLDSLHFKNVWVIGHSIGGAIGLRLAYTRPDLVRALVTLEGGPTEEVATTEFKHAATYIPWIKWLGGIKVIRRVLQRTLKAASGDTSWVTEGIVFGYTAGAARNVDATLKSYLAMARSRERVQLEPHLGEIRCPVRLVLGGARHDGGVGPEEVRELRRRVPGFEVDSVPGAGHYLQEERPEAVLATLQRARASLLDRARNPDDPAR